MFIPGAWKFTLTISLFFFFLVKKSLAQLCNVTPVELSAEKDTKKSIETSIFKLNHDY